MLVDVHTHPIPFVMHVFEIVGLFYENVLVCDSNIIQILYVLSVAFMNVKRLGDVLNIRCTKINRVLFFLPLTASHNGNRCGFLTMNRFPSLLVRINVGQITDKGFQQQGEIDE